MDNKSRANGDSVEAVATAVRDACVQAALNAYENARMDGLCHDGAWEVAVGAIRALNVQRIIQQTETRGR